jgi:DNA-binding GntR family transcriptional regulator
MRRSLAEFAYTTMREILREGRLKPGEHLPETDIADWLGISRTPVREAVRRLISEGLLANGPWNGAIVAEPDFQQLVELYAVRESLEGTAAALAAQHASTAEIKHLSGILEREKAAKRDPRRLVEINFDFHHRLYCAAHNRYLLQSLNLVVDTLGLLRHSTFVLSGSAKAAHDQHKRIIAAIEKRSPEEAEAAARQHVREALELRLQLAGRDA